MKSAEGVVEERIAVRRVSQPGTLESSAEKERVIRDLLVAREMARVDLGLDLLVAQPRSS
jgi:hypothetical protein